MRGAQNLVDRLAHAGRHLPAAVGLNGVGRGGQGLGLGRGGRRRLKVGEHGMRGRGQERKR